MDFFVYHSDDYCENGGHALVRFDSKDAAVKFIDTRIQQTGGSLDRYTLIEGRKLTLSAKEVVTKVVAE